MGMRSIVAPRFSTCGEPSVGWLCDIIAGCTVRTGRRVLRSLDLRSDAGSYGAYSIALAVAVEVKSGRDPAAS